MLSSASLPGKELEASFSTSNAIIPSAGSRSIQALELCNKGTPV
jgi:hypothetical protein